MGRRLGSLGAERREPRNSQDLREGWDPRGLEEGDKGTLGTWQGKRLGPCRKGVVYRHKDKSLLLRQP